MKIRRLAESKAELLKLLMDKILQTNTTDEQLKNEAEKLYSNQDVEGLKILLSYLDSPDYLASVPGHLSREAAEEQLFAIKSEIRNGNETYTDPNWAKEEIEASIMRLNYDDANDHLDSENIKYMFENMAMWSSDLSKKYADLSNFCADMGRR